MLRPLPASVASATAFANSQAHQELAHAGDCFVYRPGRHPRMRIDGAWHESTEPPLTEAAYEELRLHLLQSCTAASARRASKLEPHPALGR